MPHPRDPAVAALQTGDPEALRTFYAELSPRVRSYVRSRGAAEPDDLTSEVFLAVFRQLREFDGTAAQLRSWVFSIAHNKVVDELRRRSRRPEVVDYDPEADRRLAPSAEDAGLAGIASARVERLLAPLPTDQRTVLLLRIVGDLTVEQVARVVGKRPGAVKALQRRGLARVRAALEDEGVPLQDPPSIT